MIAGKLEEMEVLVTHSPAIHYSLFTIHYSLFKITEHLFDHLFPFTANFSISFYLDRYSLSNTFQP